MNGVNLNNPELKLVKADSQFSVEALSSSPFQAGNAANPASSLAASQSAGGASNVDAVANPNANPPASSGDQKSLNEAVSQLNDFVQTVQRELQFEVDNEKGQTIVKVVDQSSQKVIRQIPDEVALRLAENLQQDEPLTLFDIKV
ncbi:flagellar protein FlaG [Marinobacter litoralis]|uniref:flagellar protein FlaG n=1 Tax=Marinobacter litoralis TaxID=187981 RepID=UPI0018EAF16C|nr:flagellar protein FlaG [Marinobacter litoralis]MBJ6137375.1 flagellar protein FlaG [Marinobacter litoralis]